MPPETEVVTCPACRHLLRVPADWLGQAVQCPECKARFTAPARDGDRLTDPVLLEGPPDKPAAPRAKGRADPLLMLPAFGLLFVGAAGSFVNGAKTAEYVRNPDAAKDDILRLTEQGRKNGAVADGPENPEERRKFDEDRAAELAPKIRVLVPVFAGVSGFVFYGGLAMLLRKHRRMAQIGCVLAALNVANGCCVPGAVFGLWGLLMLGSDEGREHFG